MITALLCLVATQSDIGFLDRRNEWMNVSQFLRTSGGSTALTLENPPVVSEDGATILLAVPPHPRTESTPDVDLYDVIAGRWRASIRVGLSLYRNPSEMFAGIARQESFAPSSQPDPTRTVRTSYRSMLLLAANDDSEFKFLGVAQLPGRSGYSREQRSRYGLFSLSAIDRPTNVQRPLPSSPPAYYRVLSWLQSGANRLYVLLAHVKPASTQLETWSLRGQTLTRLKTGDPKSPWPHLDMRTVPSYPPATDDDPAYSQSAKSLRPVVVTVDPDRVRALYADSNTFWEFDLKSRTWRKFPTAAGYYNPSPFYWRGVLYANFANKTKPGPMPTFMVDSRRKKWTSLGKYRIAGRSAGGKYWLVVGTGGDEAWVARSR